MKKLFVLAAVCAGFTAFAALPPNVPANGLMGWWPLDGSASDLSINANHGTINGATPATDRFNISGHAFNFDGSSNYIRVPSAPVLSGYSDMTISLWFKTSSFTGTQCMVTKWWQHLNCGNNTDNYNIALINNQLEFATNMNNFGLNSHPYLITGDMNAWTHLVFTYDHTTSALSIYKNNALLYSEVVSGSGICSSTNDLFFGADEDGNNVTPPMIYRFFNGALDDIGIWNRVLTANEIDGLYRPATVGLPAYTKSNSLLLSQNEPNPFSHETTVNYSLPQTVGTAFIAVYDLTGKQITTFNISQRGASSMTISSEKLAAGIYMYSIVADGKVLASKRMIVTEK